MAELSIDSVGMTNPYTQNYYNDPYFMAAFNSPNANNIAFNGTATSPQQAVINQGQQDISANQHQVQPKEKNSRAGLILTGILAVGATALGFAAHKAGNPNLKFFQRLGDGIGTLWKDGLKKIGINTQKYNKVIEENGCKYVRIEGDNIEIKENIEEEAKKLGINIQEKIKFGHADTEFVEAEIAYKGKDYLISKDTIFLNNNNQKETCTNLDDELKNIINSVKENSNGIPSDVKINHFIYNFNHDGTVVQYKINDNNAEPILNMIKTDRHAIS